MAPPPSSNQPAARPPKRDFIGKPAPPGYVAGIGRGATGFTTRSDIGPAREPAFVRSQGEPVASTSSGALARRAADNEDEEEDLNESNYDEFAGYGGSLFKGDPYDNDDAEADKIYTEIDKHIDERGKALREAKARQELEVYRQKRPRIQQQFNDLKAELRQVSMEEWFNLPDVGDARNRKQRVARQDKYTPAPDSLLAHQARLATGGERLVYLDPRAAGESDSEEEDENDRTGEAGTADKKKPVLPLADGPSLNIGEMSEFRSSYMSMQLSRVSDTSGDNNQAPATNAQDYLTNLQSMTTSQITDTATVNEYRKQFAALRASNPTFSNAWIASVRLEEAAGKLKAAKSLILAACENCPKSADLWLEAIRLHPADYAKPFMVKALKEVPRSDKLWLKAAELENSDEARRRVFAKARELIPKSEMLWRRSIELELPEQARALLKEAVACCPNSVDLWLALARLLPYKEATVILKEANEKNPKDRTIWLTAAKLQEQVGKYDLVEKIITLSVSDLAEKGVEIVRAEWFREAADADRANFKITCREIIRRIIGWNISEPERLKTWLGDAKDFIKSGSISCARAVFEMIVEDKVFSKMESVWQEFANFERTCGDNDSLIGVLQRAVGREHCRHSEALWLVLTDEKRADLADCRRTLSDALMANPDSERIVVAAVELECSNGNYKEARRILADACMSAKTPQLVMRAAKLEWSLGNIDEAIRMLKAGISEYKNYPDFFLSIGQIEEQRDNLEGAKDCYSNGLKFNPTSVELWISIAHLEEKTGFIARARSRLEMARLRNAKNVQLWLEAAKLEWKQYTAKAASGPQRSRPDMVHTLLAKGIKECKDQPDVGRLVEMQAEITKRKFG